METLETLTQRNEQLETEVTQLKMTVETLRASSAADSVRTIKVNSSTAQEEEIQELKQHLQVRMPH